ncbi:RCC1 domain-containing protein [Cystobacter fuscus]|uniref:RCC1 domain-containing protein n=1 Tax=Cystobacter fuscus TaxID=43 RepID=UPI002B31FB18|nr:hypothetical protein F0U63_31690 [Cystobacter fuscus]
MQINAERWLTRLLGVWLAVLVVACGQSIDAPGASEQGTPSNHSAPVQMPGPRGVVFVAANETHSLVELPDGTLWATGANDSGQLGQGTPGDRLVPMQVEVGSRLLSLSAGRSHSLAVRADGTVWAWGRNHYGQLGACPAVLHRRSPRPPV